MRRENVKDLLEVLGGLAIIASLIFVGIETRNGALQTEQNTHAIQISAYQDLIDNISDMNRITVESREVAALMLKVFRDEEELTELESFQMSRAFYLRFRHGDMAYFQYERGAIDEERLLSVLRPLSLSHPRIQAFWENNRQNFAVDYANYIDKLIVEHKAGE